MPGGVQLYNSLTRRKEAFVPHDSKRVRLYHCGPTVYRRQHIGNLRRYLFADLLRRTLELWGFTVYEVMNITDVGHLTLDELDAGEDKLEVAAREQHTTPSAIAQMHITLFHEDIRALNIQAAHVYPRATEHIAQMQELIAALLQRGHAYQTRSGVYFSVRSWPAYGALSGNRLATRAGARVPVREEKHNPADFALWKTEDPHHVQQWDSPWGRGYPGWHIECSAMSQAYLGNEIDIHTGGEDNRFPHHENEIAQSEAASGARFVRRWMHNAHLRFQGAKLAKRSGVQITLKTIVERGHTPLAFRLLAFGAHYRQAIDFSWELMAAASENLATLKQLTRRLAPILPPAGKFAPDATVVRAFRDALADDLNSPLALAGMMDYVRRVNGLLAGKPAAEQLGHAWATLAAFDQVLGIFGPLHDELSAETAPPAVMVLSEQRESARAAADFATADRLRQQIEQAGWLVEDTPEGPRLIKS